MAQSGMNKIIVAACIRQDPAVLAAYCRSLKNLQAPYGTEIKFGFINDAPMLERQQTLDILQQLEPAVVLPAEPRPVDAVYQVDQQTHRWNVSTFEHLARQKQRLLDYAVEAGYSHIFLVDSDLLMEPSTLRMLYASRVEVANGVFWTHWQNEPGTAPLPQCWLGHPYNLSGYGKQDFEFIGTLAERQMLRCAGGGACVLIATSALRKGLHYHPRLAGLPQDGMWQGEDRTLAIIAERRHIRQYADGWPDIFHAYHPEQRQPEVLAAIERILQAPRQEQANYGDLVAFTVDPLEDIGLQDTLHRNPQLRCIRGRLGGIKMAPEIEYEISRMRVGDENIIEVKFPPWHAVPGYQGRSTLLKVGLLDCKPYSYAPVLADTAFAGIKV